VVLHLNILGRNKNNIIDSLAVNFFILVSMGHHCKMPSNKTTNLYVWDVVLQEYMLIFSVLRGLNVIVIVIFCV